MTRARGAAPEAVLTVSMLTASIRDALAGPFGAVWVQGEVGQIRKSGAGHLYISLKDERAVLPAVLWRSTAARLSFALEEGQEVIVQGAIDVYLPHGRYQLVVRRVEPVGAGALQLAFEQLRRRLEAEGLFDPARKRPLPTLPRRIALVTSATGAAVRDMVTVIRRRFPATELVLVSTRVQGAGAAREIAEALDRADRLAGADVILVGRGGGSLEDLQAFNEEVVARAIAASRTPVISAVGHETDVTIADLVADVRAATPSEAAERVVPLREDLEHRLDALRRRLTSRLRRSVDHAWQRVEAQADRAVLRDHRTWIGPRRRRLEHLAARLRSQSPVASLTRRSERVAQLGARLLPPLERRVAEGRHELEGLSRRARRAIENVLQRRTLGLGPLESALEALSPLAVLGRGYSLTRTADGRVVRRGDDVASGDALDTWLADGARVRSVVDGVTRAGGEGRS